MRQRWWWWRRGWTMRVATVARQWCWRRSNIIVKLYEFIWFLKWNYTKLSAMMLGGLTDFESKWKITFLMVIFEWNFGWWFIKRDFSNCWWILLPRRSRRILIECSEGKRPGGFEEVIDRFIHPIDNQWNEKLLSAKITTFSSIHPTLATLNPFATFKTTDIPLKCYSLCQFHWRTRKIHCLCFFTFKSTRLKSLFSHTKISFWVSRKRSKNHTNTPT